MPITNIELAKHSLGIANEASIWAEHALTDKTKSHDQFDMNGGHMLVKKLEAKLNDLKKALIEPKI